jgi:hypothetical protein
MTSQASMSVTIFGMPLRHAFGQRLAVELAQLLDLGAGLPADALAAVAQLVHQGAERGEALEHVRVVALDHRDLRRGLAGDQLALALLPLLHVEGLGQLTGGVVHDGRQHHLAFSRPGGRRRPR